MNINVICLLCVVSFFNFLLLLVLTIQCIVSIGLVTQNLIPNYQLSFFKLAQLAQLSQRI